MRPLDLLTAAAPQGYELLKELHRESKTCSQEQLADRVGIAIAALRKMLRTYQILGGRLHGADGLNVHRLEVVANAYKATGGKDKEKLDILLGLARGCGSVEETTKVLRSQVSQWKTAPRRPDTLQFERQAGMDGKRQIIGRIDAAKVATMEAVLLPVAQKLRRNNPAMPLATAMAEALYRAVIARKVTGEPTLLAPAFVIPLRGQYRYFADGMIATAQGGLVDLETVINDELADTGYVCVIAKDGQGINQAVGTYPVRRAGQATTVGRLATLEQRRSAALETLVCAHPECTVPAVSCQTHHIVAWKHGGETTAPNLVSLCAFHNGTNDDNPERHKNGRIERDPTTGAPGLRPRPGEPIRPNRLPVTTKGWRALQLE